jgi:hypothetical protein
VETRGDVFVIVTRVLPSDLTKVLCCQPREHFVFVVVVVHTVLLSLCDVVQPLHAVVLLGL